MTFMTIKGLLRRLAGHDGLQAVTPVPPDRVAEQARKRIAADRTIRDAQRAVDSFTAGIERAMRGHQTR